MTVARVSVVVPVYNAGNKLHKCIKSILTQTMREIEIILVNDGSTDQSLDVCRKYGDKDSRIIVIDKPNEGSIATRRKGVEAAAADYVTFVDADDWIDPDAIGALYSAAIENDADVTSCTSYRVVGDYGLIKHRFTSRYFTGDKLYIGDEVRTELAGAAFHGHPYPSVLWGKLYKKHLLLQCGKYLERIKFLGDDLYYNLEMLLHAERVKLIDRPLYFYRAGGFTNKYMPHLFDDTVHGYEIQKEVIAEYFQDSKERREKGIAIMLLNTFPPCVLNLFRGSFGKAWIEAKLTEYLANPNVIECATHEGALKFFAEHPAAHLPMTYIQAIQTQNVDALYAAGLQTFNQGKYKNLLMNALAKAL